MRLRRPLASVINEAVAKAQRAKFRMMCCNRVDDDLCCGGRRWYEASYDALYLAWHTPGFREQIELQLALLALAEEVTSGTEP